jgi:hypothetical protein
VISAGNYMKLKRNVQNFAQIDAGLHLI